jgi:hypothetical protein
VTIQYVLRVNYGSCACSRSGCDWVEIKSDGAQSFHSNERSRAGSKVPLFDPGRNVSITMDLASKGIPYGVGAATEIR